MIESQFIRVGEINTHYLVAGEGSPVILIHGVGAGVFDWKFIVRLFVIQRWNQFFEQERVGVQP